MSKGSVYLNITIIGRVITIWDEVFCKLRVSFDGLSSMEKVSSESSHCTETHIYVIEEVLEVQRIVYYELFLDENFIEFW